jgi:hypothetical protein
MLGGLSPLIIFTFFKVIPQNFIGPTQPIINPLPSVPIRIPLLPIPLYLNERFTGIQLDDYDRDISIDVMRDAVTSFERVSGDVVNLKFRMQKNNIILTALTALIDRIMKTFDRQVNTQYTDRDYILTIFYDNIFILDASLERFHSSLVEGTDLREVSFTFSKRSQKSTALTQAPIARTVGTVAGT